MEAARATLARLQGAFALAFLFQDEPDLLIAARKGSPLAVGHGDKEMYLGSDAVALAPFTDRITYLEDGDHAVLTRAGVQIWGQRRATRSTAPPPASMSARPSSTVPGTVTSWPRKSPNSRW